MSAFILEIARAIALLALMAAFAYGFAIRVSRKSVAAAVVASAAYGATEAPQILSHYRFESSGLIVAAAIAAVVAVGALAWAFYRWPVAIAPTLALLAAIRIPIPVSRAGVGGAAAEYLFLLIPLYAATVAALVAEVVRPDTEVAPLWRRDPVRLPICWLVMWAAFSTLWTAGPVQGPVRLYAFWLLLPAAYHAIWRGLRLHEPAPGALASGPAAASVPRSWRTTIETIVVAGIVFALVGIWQHAGHWLLFKNTNVESSQWQQVIFRVNAIFWDPNIFARYLILTGLLAGAAWFVVKGPWRWLVLGVAPMLAAFYFTYSRSGWLVAVIAIALVVWLRLGWTRALAVLLVLLLVLGAAMLVIRAPKFRKTTIELFQSTLGIVKNGHIELQTPINKLTGGRYGLIEGGIKMSQARPLHGWGLGSFPTVYPRYRPPNAPPALRESHNSIVTVAAELGAIGLALLAWVIFAVVRMLAQSLSRSAGARHTVAAAVTGGLLAIFIHSLLYAALVEDPFTWVLLALLPLAMSAAAAYAAGAAVPSRAPVPAGAPGAAKLEHQADA